MGAKKSRKGADTSRTKGKGGRSAGANKKVAANAMPRKKADGPEDALSNLSRKDLLRLNSLLISLSDEAFERCYDRCRFGDFLAGEVIIAAESPGNEVYFVVAGTARTVDGADEGFDLISNDVEAGGWFGEISAIDEASRTATVTAYTDVVVASIPREVFINLILEHRTVALKVLEDFSMYLRMSATRVKKVSAYTGAQRVYMELLRQAEPDPRGDGSWQITKWVKHKELAIEASTSLDIVARAISHLIKLGLMKREGGSFRILDRERVQQMVNQT